MDQRVYLNIHGYRSRARVGRRVFFQHLRAILTLLLLPNRLNSLYHCPCPLARNFGSRVNGLVILFSFLLFLFHCFCCYFRFPSCFHFCYHCFLLFSFLFRCCFCVCVCCCSCLFLLLLLLFLFFMALLFCLLFFVLVVVMAIVFVFVVVVFVFNVCFGSWFPFCRFFFLFFFCFFVFVFCLLFCFRCCGCFCCQLSLLSVIVVSECHCCGCRHCRLLLFLVVYVAVIIAVSSLTVLSLSLMS